MGEWESVCVKGNANSDLTAVIAMLLVVSVLGLGVGSAESLEKAVGDVVENDAAAGREKIKLTLAQGGLDVLVQSHEIIAGAVEAVLGAFGDADVGEFEDSGVPPTAQKPYLPAWNFEMRSKPQQPHFVRGEG